MAGCMAVFLVATVARGQDVPSGVEAVQQPGSRHHEHGAAGGGWSEWHHATGDWGGLRSRLLELGFIPELFATTDASLLASGGVDPGGTALRTLMDATLSVDGGRLLGWGGATFHLDFQVQRGQDGSLDTGDLQRYSNIDEVERTQLARLWFEQTFAGEAVRLRLGKTDVNADFDYVEHGYRFLHASFGHSPTLLAMPTYPDPSYGAALLTEPGGGCYANLGVYDGATKAGIATGPRGPRTLFAAPSDLYLIGEGGWRWGRGEGGMHGRLAFGAWWHTGRFERFDGGSDDGTTGYYAVAEQQLTHGRVGGDAVHGGLGAFLMYGWADPQLSPLEHHVGGGLEWTGPLASRPDDALGLGANWASFSDAAGLHGDGELAVELFYQWQVTPWFSLQPDVQWIHSPGGLADVDDALVLTLRTSITF